MSDRAFEAGKWLLVVGLGVGGCNVLAGIGDLPYPGGDASDAGSTQSDATAEGSQSTPDGAFTDAGGDVADGMAHDETGSPGDAGDGAAAFDSGSSDANDASNVAVVGWDGGPWDAGAVDLAAPYFVQVGTKTGVGPDASTLQVVADLPAHVTAHDTLIIAADFTTAAPPTLTDTLGNTFVPVVGPFGDGVGTWAAIWYVPDALAGAEAVTATLASGTPDDYVELYVHEYRGLHGFDSASDDTGTSMAVSSGPFSTSQANDLLFAYVATGSAGWVAPFSPRSTDNANLSEDTLAGPAGSYQALAVMQSGSGWIMVAAAFKTH